MRSVPFRTNYFAVKQKKPTPTPTTHLVQEIVSDEGLQERRAHRHGGDSRLLPVVFPLHGCPEVEQEGPLAEVDPHRLPGAVQAHAGVQARGVQGAVYAREGGAQQLPVVGQERLHGVCMKGIRHGRRKVEI